MRTGIFTLVLLAFSQVQCQLELIEDLVQQQQQLLQQRQQRQQRQQSGIGGMIRMITNTVRDTIVNDILGGAVKFVVHPTAEISPELRQYGTALGRAPRTKEEREKFTDLMKQVARRTPALMNQYVKKVTSHKNGTITHDYDYYGLDADIIRRAMLYQRIRTARSEVRREHRELAQQLDALLEDPFYRDLAMYEPNLILDIILGPAPSNTNNQTSTITQTTTNSTAPNVTISLLDILSPQGGINNQQATAQPQPVHLDLGNTMSIKVVGAIDIGTSYSGWAFSLPKEVDHIYTKQWGGNYNSDEKTRTCLLVAPDKQTVEAFGDEAEKKFVDLTINEEQNEFYFFRDFKNVLKFAKKIDKDLTIQEEMGKSLPALDVFKMTIKYLSEDMMKKINELHEQEAKEEKRTSPNTVDKTNVLWVITVPAIWTQATRYFMREAASQAGLSYDRVILAVEPEVTSIYCQTMSTHDSVNHKWIQFPIGSRYVVLDAGGGTIDITVHEVEEDLAVKEVTVANGEGWGATIINEKIEECLKEIIGEDVFEGFKQNDLHNWFNMMREIEINKRKIHPIKDYRVSLTLPRSLYKMVKERYNQTIEERIRELKYSKKITVKEQQIILSTDLCRSFFAEAIDKLVKLLNDQIARVKKGKPKTIMMAGGFSESPMVYQAIQKAFPKMHVVVPVNSNCAVLRGAVRYGHHPMSISERVLKYTYGVEVMRKFIPGKHPESKRVKTDKGDHCKNVFSKHVEKQQVVKVGESQVEQRYTPSHNDKTTARIKLFISHDKNPKYTDDRSCTCIGEVTFDLPEHDGDLKRGLWVSYTFSGPEILVDVYDEKTGKTVEARTLFLGPSMN
ncbi:hypothetical protein ACF0H5_003841 [Mactra antiquata]